MTDVLEGKKIVVIGDSLIYGGSIGKEITWVNKLTKYGMIPYNYGICGNSIAQNDQDRHPPMCERYIEMEDGADYVVVLGGANDRNYDIPIGENDSDDPRTFKGAINVLIRGLIKKYPRARILFMTNYDRWRAPNHIGLCDIDYVTAMEEVCHRHSIPCFNNYYNSGINFNNPDQNAWMDEGPYRGKGANYHFSPEGYDWLLPKYAAILRML